MNINGVPWYVSLFQNGSADIIVNSSKQNYSDYVNLVSTTAPDVGSFRLYSKNTGFYYKDPSNVEYSLAAALNISLIWSIEGRVNLPTTPTTATQLDFTLQDPSGSANYPNLYRLEEYNPIHRSGNTITAPSDGWYKIELVMAHPSQLIISTSFSQQSSGVQSKLFISFNGLTGSQLIPFTMMETNPTVSYCMSGSITKYLTTGMTFSFYHQFQNSVTNEEYFITASLIKFA